MAKLKIYRCYRKILDKLRAFFGYLSSSKRIDLSFLAALLSGHFMRLSMSSSYRSFAARRAEKAARRLAEKKSAAARRRARRKHRKPRAAPRKKPRHAPTLSSNPSRRLDAFLVAATLVALMLVTSSYFRRTTQAYVHDPTPFVSIFVSPQYWAMFGGIAYTLVREFEGQHPGFRIAMAEPEDSDVVFFDDSEFAFLVESGALASLAPYVYTESEGDQLAVPLVAFADIFIYNIDILQRAGNDRPPGTRAEFLAASRSVAALAADAQEEIFPFALGLCETDSLGVRRDFHPWVWAAGAETHSGFAQDGSPTLTTATANAINFFAEMSREGLIAPGTFETTGQERLEQFADGRIAMLAASTRDILFMRNSPSGINFDITSIPAVALGRNRMALSGIYAGISSSSEQSDEAWAFIVFMAGRSHLLSAALGAVPGSFFVGFPGRHVEEDPLFSKAWELFDAADIVEFDSSDFSEKEAARAIWERLVQALDAR